MYIRVTTGARMSAMKSVHIWSYGLALCVAAVIIVLYYQQIPLLEGIEAKTWDSRLRLARPDTTPHKDVAIVAIDEKSIAEIGRFPWSRSIYARFIDAAHRGGSRAVLLDVLFPEEESAVSDSSFAAAMKRHGSVVQAEYFEYGPQGTTVGYKRNTPLLRSAAKAFGHINLFPDEDGVIRWSHLVVPFEDTSHFALALRGAAAVLGDPPITLKPYAVQLGDRIIPTDDQHRMLINFAASAANFETFSFSDILHDRVPAERLRNRVLFVGATAVGIYDMRVTPVSGNMPGVALNAVVADSIVRGSFMKRGGVETLIDCAAIIILSLATVAIILHGKHSTTLPLLVLLAGGYAFACHYALTSGSWISMFYPLTAMMLTFIGAAFIRFQFLDRRAREVKSMFSRFVSAKIVDRLVKNPELACISGDNRVVTIMFADIQNYTSFSERHEPKDIVKVLNMYLSEMVSVIMEFDGTLDKFLGDGIMAYWNAPVEQPGHAELAVRCAIEMIRRSEGVQKKIAVECGEPLSWGIGINSGVVVAGIIGAAEKKMEYTLIGDNVNLTYRIQSNSREAGCPVITRALYDMVADIVEVEQLDPVYVKGKEKPLEIFALKGMKHE